MGTTILTSEEREALALRLEVAMAEKAAAELQLKLRELGPATATVVEPTQPKPKRGRKKKEPVSPVTSEIPDTVPLPECIGDHVGSDTVPLYKVVYVSGAGKMEVYGVAGDQMKTFNAGTDKEETKRMLWLRSLLRDGSRMVVMTAANSGTRGFNVPALEPARSGGKVLGMVPGSFFFDDEAPSLKIETETIPF